MSILHFIHTKKKIDSDYLLKQIRNEVGDVVMVQRETTLYFHLKNLSARGVDLSEEQYGYEIRNTGLSNEADYMVTNAIAKYVCMQTGSKIIDEEKKQANPECLFSEREWRNRYAGDAQMVHAISKENDDIEVYGPTGSIYFGQRTHQMFKPFEKNSTLLADKMNQLIMKVLYQLPKLESNTVLAIKSDNGKDKIIKVISRENSYIIKKYDYIILTRDNQEKDGLLMITNKHLNNFLPKEWKLIDEYTIVATPLSVESWNYLIERALPYNQKEIK